MKQKKEESVKEAPASVPAVAEEQVTTVSLSQAMADTGVSASDLVIPKLLLMQNTSEYVGDDKAKLGDIVNSQTLEVLGGFNQQVDIIPLKVYKTWRVYDMTGGQPKFMRQDTVTSSNEKLPWDDTEDGHPIRRDMCMNFFVLLLSEVSKGEAFPCVVSFKRTSMQAGKTLATHLFKMSAMNRPPYSQSVALKVSKQKKDTNTYGTYEIGKGSEISLEYKREAAKWLEMLSKIAYKVDEEQEETETPAAAPVIVGGSPSDMKF